MHNFDDIASRPLNPLDNLICFAEKVDGKWHQSLEWMEKLIAYAQGAFCKVQSQLSPNSSFKISFDSSSEECLNYTLCSISRNSLRITDAVLCLLLSGHPDAALGLTRTLFEYFVDSYLVSLDKTGKCAWRYIVYDNGHYWEKIVKINSKNDNCNEEVKAAIKNLAKLKELLGVDKFKSSNQWAEMPDGCRLNSMDEKIEYIANHGVGVKHIDFLKGVWLRSNKWAHGSSVASHNSLGTPGSLSRSYIGLEDPIEEASQLLVLVLSVYFEFAVSKDIITDEIYSFMNQLQGIQQCITQSLAEHSE